MPKYLWDLDIEQIPLGWEETYQDALKTCPDGEIVGIQDSSDTVPSRHFYHPVGYRAKLITLFNEAKSKASKLLESEKDFKSLTDQLVKLDIHLFSLLADWLRVENDISGESLDPKNLDRHLFDLEIYDSPYPDELKKYAHLRLVNLS